MVLLSDGNVLIAGGASTTKVVGNIVLFNVTDQTFTPIGTLLTARTNAAAAATQDGRVLIVGGADINGAVLASTEVFIYSTSTMTGTVWPVLPCRIPACSPRLPARTTVWL